MGCAKPIIGRQRRVVAQFALSGAAAGRRALSATGGSACLLDGHRIEILCKRSGYILVEGDVVLFRSLIKAFYGSWSLKV